MSSDLDLRLLVDIVWQHATESTAVPSTKTADMLIAKYWQSLRALPPDKLHPSHKTRVSDASSFDEICVNCGATDNAGGGWGRLKYPCPSNKEGDHERS